jgi:hypothetical protein
MVEGICSLYDQSRRRIVIMGEIPLFLIGSEMGLDLLSELSEL